MQRKWQNEKICKKIAPLLIFEICSFFALAVITCFLTHDSSIRGILSYFNAFYRIYAYVLAAIFGSSLVIIFTKNTAHTVINLTGRLLSYALSIIGGYYFCYRSFLNTVFADASGENLMQLFLKMVLGLIFTCFLAIVLTWIIFVLCRRYDNLRESLGKWKVEILVFAYLLGRLILDNPGAVEDWCSAWYAMDYQTFGLASRMLPGTILRIITNGAYITGKIAYLFVFCTLLLIMLLISLLIGQVIRHCTDLTQKAVLFIVLVYLAAPFGPDYLIELSGKLEIFAVFFVLIAVAGFHLIRNDVLRYAFVALMSVACMACHQGYLFLYFTVIFTMLVAEVARCWENHEKTTGSLIGGMAVCAANAVSFLYFQFAAVVQNVGSAEEMAGILAERTDMEIYTDALYYEYFTGVKTAFEEINEGFLLKGEYPREHSFLQLIVLIPFIVLIIALWRRVIRDSKKMYTHITTNPYVWMLTCNLVILPEFVLNVDWGRWWGALGTVLIFQILYLAYMGGELTVGAFAALQNFVEEHWLVCAVFLIYLANLETICGRLFPTFVNNLFQLVYNGNLYF